VGIDSDRHLNFYEVTTLENEGATQLALNTWYMIEFVVNATTGLGLRINGVTEWTGSSSVAAARVKFGRYANISSEAVRFYYDDICLSSTWYPGPGGCIAVHPDADGYVNDFAASSGTRHDCVNEVVPEGVNYVSAAIAGVAKAQTFAFSAANAGLALITGHVLGVKPVISAKVSLKTNETPKLRWRYWGTNTDLSAYTFAANDTYVTLQTCLDSHDSRAVAIWGKYDAYNLQGMEVGIVSGTSDDDPDTTVTLQYAALMVDFCADYQTVQIVSGAEAGLAEYATVSGNVALCGDGIADTMKRSGAYALKFTPGDNSTAAYVTFRPKGDDGRDANNDVTAGMYIRLYARFSAFPSSNHELIAHFGNVSNAKKLTLDIVSTGEVQINDKDGATLDTLAALSLNTWYRIEAFCGRGTSAAWAAKIYVDSTGALHDEGSGTTGNLTDSALRTCTLGKVENSHSKGYTMYVDDIALSTSNWIGPGSVVALHPNAAGYVGEWAASAGDAYACVDEAGLHNDVTDNIYYETDGTLKAHSFNLEASSVPSINGKINAVMAWAVAAEDATPTTHKGFRLFGRSNSANFTTTTVNLSTTWTPRGRVFPHDPDSRNALTTAILDAFEVGIDNNTATASAPVACVERVTQVMLMVDFGPPYNYTSALADGIGIADALAGVAGFQAALAVGLGVVDAVVGRAGFRSPLGDGLGVTDGVVGRAGFQAGLAESLGIAESPTGQAGFQAAIGDGVGVVDAVTGRAGFQSGLAESIGVSETVTGRAGFVAALSESLGITAAVSGVAHFLANIAESLGIADVLTDVYTAATVTVRKGIVRFNRIFGRGIGPD
jgi:hypothetical protein